MISRYTKGKKLFAMLIVFAMMAMSTFNVVPVQAGEQHVLQVSNGSGSPGDTVTLTVTLNQKQGLAGLQYIVRFDPSQFEIASRDWATNVWFNSSTTFNDEGYISFASATDELFSESGTLDLVKINFLVKEGAINGVYLITLTNLLGTGEGYVDVALGTPIAGSITVTGGIVTDDASLTSVKVAEEVATANPEDPTKYDVTLPAGTDLSELVAADIKVETSDPNAEVGTLATNDGGKTWIFDVTARDGVTEVTYTVVITVEELDTDPLTDAIAAANEAKEGVAVSADGTDVPMGDDWVTQAALDALNDAIDAAEEALDNAVTQADINDAADALNDAIDSFNSSIAFGTKAKSITDNNIKGLKPVRGANPVINIDTPQYTGTVTWDPAVAAGKKFAASTVYYAQITIAPKMGWTLNGLSNTFFTVADADEIVYSVDNPGSFEARFPKTAAATSGGGGGGGGGVVAPTATDIEIKSAPDKVVYTEGDELVLTGLEVIVTYSDGNKKTIGIKDFADNDITVSPKAGDVLEAGDSEIVIKVNSKTVKQAITVNEKAIITPPDEGKDELVLTDISEHWAQANIEYLVGIGAIAGYPDGTFKPDAPITRAEFAKVIVEAFELEGVGKVFEDTAQHWSKNYVAIAAAKGIVLGYNDNEFGPDDLITREQMSIMIVKSAGLTSKAGVLNFADEADISSWAYDWVVSAAENELMSGYTDNTFKPLNNATRAEAATVIYNVLMK